jgi:hypothetical protein
LPSQLTVIETPHRRSQPYLLNLPEVVLSLSMQWDCQTIEDGVGPIAAADGNEGTYIILFNF